MLRYVLGLLCEAVAKIKKKKCLSNCFAFHFVSYFLNALQWFQFHYFNQV